MTKTIHLSPSFLFPYKRCGSQNWQWSLLTLSKTPVHVRGDRNPTSFLPRPFRSSLFFFFIVSMDFFLRVVGSRSFISGTVRNEEWRRPFRQPTECRETNKSKQVREAKIGLVDLFCSLFFFARVTGHNDVHIPFVYYPLCIISRTAYMPWWCSCSCEKIRAHRHGLEGREREVIMLFVDVV